jgi:hypothetical protein
VTFQIDNEGSAQGIIDASIFTEIAYFKSGFADKKLIAVPPLRAKHVSSAITCLGNFHETASESSEGDPICVTRSSMAYRSISKRTIWRMASLKARLH